MAIVHFPDDWPSPPVPKKKTLTPEEAYTLIVKEARYRIGCESFAPVFTLRRAEPDTRGRYPSANWDATPEAADTWPPDCAQAFRETVLRTRGKYDVAWPR